MTTLHQVMKGTEMKPPPAPTSPDNTPITVPAPSMPGGGGNSRVGLGFLSNSICVAENPTKIAKNIARPEELSWVPIHGPTHEPIRMPGASSLTTGHNTAPRL